MVVVLVGNKSVGKEDSLSEYFDEASDSSTIQSERENLICFFCTSFVLVASTSFDLSLAADARCVLSFLRSLPR